MKEVHIITSHTRSQSLNNRELAEHTEVFADPQHEARQTLFGKQMSGCLFSQNAFPRAKGILNHSTPPQLTELVTGTLSTCCSVQTGGRRSYFDPLWGTSSFSVESQLDFMAGEDACASALWQSRGAGILSRHNGTSSPITQGLEFGVNAVLIAKLQRQSQGKRGLCGLKWHSILQTRQSAETLGRAGCSCRSECRTMRACADFWPEQWQDDMEPDRYTQSSRIYTADRRGSFTEQQHCQKTSPHLPFSSSNIFYVFWHLWYSELKLRNSEQHRQHNHGVKSQCRLKKAPWCSNGLYIMGGKENMLIKNPTCW